MEHPMVYPKERSMGYTYDMTHGVSRATTHGWPVPSHGSSHMPLASHRSSHGSSHRTSLGMGNVLWDVPCDDKLPYVKSHESFHRSSHGESHNMGNTPWDNIWNVPWQYTLPVGHTMERSMGRCHTHGTSHGTTHTTYRPIVSLVVP